MPELFDDGRPGALCVLTNQWIIVEIPTNGGECHIRLLLKLLGSNKVMMIEQMNSGGQESMIIGTLGVREMMSVMVLSVGLCSLFGLNK